jgi:predicted short-subunit dehydrogenase-like oxidoreductase (DUF2520 family)
MMDLTIIGAGRAAWAFGRTWKRTGGEIRAILTRAGTGSETAARLATEERPILPDAIGDAEIVLFAVPDRAITGVYEILRPAIPERAPLFHASGALTSGLFDRSHCFSLHPLRSLPAAGSDSLDLAGTIFTWEGDPGTLEIAGAIVRAAGGDLRRLDPRRKLLYHAAAVFGSNYVAALLEESASMLEEAGIDDPRGGVSILAGSAVANWAAASDSGGFTGPIRRGDAALVEDHLSALGGDPARFEIYRHLGLSIVRALKEDPDSIGLQEIEHLLRRAVRS